MKHILKTDNLNIEINKKKLCENLNLSIAEGEIWGILGPNGCGKTTLLHTLAGLKEANHGTIRLYDQKLSEYSLKALARIRGILFQDFAEVFSETVYEFCRQGRYPHLNYFSFLNQEDEKMIQDALSDVDLLSHSKRKVQSLSGGEKQRLKIAALLAQNPSLYLLDEPTNHLDLKYQIKILQHFQKLKIKNCSTIIILHDVNLAEHFCDKILMFYPNEKCMMGETKRMLTPEHLSTLYQYPIIKLNPYGFAPNTPCKFR